MENQEVLRVLLPQLCATHGRVQSPCYPADEQGAPSDQHELFGQGCDAILRGIVACVYGKEVWEREFEVSVSAKQRSRLSVFVFYGRTSIIQALEKVRMT